MDSDHKENGDKNRPFWLGFSLVWIAFVIANIVSYNVETAEFVQKHAGEIQLSAGGYSWGVPLKMYANYWGFPNHVGFEPMPTVINLMITLAFAGFLGIGLQKLRDSFRR